MEKYFTAVLVGIYLPSIIHIFIIPRMNIDPAK